MAESVFSCALDGSHLINAIRYVELNPVRAGLIGAAWEWPWSSALAHVWAGAPDPLLDPAWTDSFPHWDYTGWKECLEPGLTVGELAAIRRATRVGEPLGASEFLGNLERLAGKRLRVLARGRPKRAPNKHWTREVYNALYSAKRLPERKKASVPFSKSHFPIGRNWRQTGFDTSIVLPVGVSRPLFRSMRN